MPPRVLPASALKKTSRNRKKNEDMDSPLVIRRSVSTTNDNIGESGNREGVSGGRPKEQFIHPNQKICLIYMKTPNQNQRLYKKNSGLA